MSPTFLPAELATASQAPSTLNIMLGSVSSHIKPAEPCCKTLASLVLKCQWITWQERMGVRERSYNIAGLNIFPSVLWENKTMQMVPFYIINIPLKKNSKVSLFLWIYKTPFFTKSLPIHYMVIGKTKLSGKSREKEERKISRSDKMPF